MSRIGKNVENRGALLPFAWLQLTMVAALILVLSGCGAGSSTGDSGQEETGENGQSAKKMEDRSTAETTARREGTVAKTEQASADGELGTPALGDSGAPVVMVEYSDYQ